MLRLLVGSLAALMISQVSTPPANAQREIRENLEGVYKRWRLAMRDKNFAEWNATTASFRQAEVRNAIVSQGGRFPDALFAVPVTPPDIRDLKLLDMRTAGLTANLIYFGEVDLGFADGKVPQNVLVLSFVLERAGGWRFDTSRLVNLAGIPEIRADLIAGRLEFLEAPEFEPRGKVPAVPPPCPKPEYFGRIDIAANGYSVMMKLNGFDYPVIMNTGRRNVVIGGFKEGENKLQLTIRPVDVPEGEERILQVGAYASRGSLNDDMTEVFVWKPEDEVPDRFENPIWVTKDRVSR